MRMHHNRLATSLIGPILNLSFSFSLILFSHAISHAASAAEVGVVGLFPGKAVLVIGSADPKTYAVGSNLGDGAKLVAVDGVSATIEVGGKRQVLQIGQHIRPKAANNSAGKVTLQADGRGHFITWVQINNGGMRMLVDTGATMIAISSAEAIRLGIDYKKGQHGYANTANGNVQIYKVTLDSVKVGDIEINQVDAFVQESGLSVGLLGMSFLKRTEMVQDSGQMTLTKRF